ncbi:hypothetical protein MKW98_010483 [Papaver atlanticum]|uniref:Uncharacterized protein n=1 Tax=Papaver atlanticum TaxID=357466 RepID=A0AAD4TBJ8_9MAGN|nr:hypothetical protein MKW98_010483 [Papaver atlanticum]
MVSCFHVCSVIEQQRIIIKNKYGESLVGVLHETGSTQVIILCHGFSSNKESYINLSVADALTKQGIIFDFSRMKRVIGGILGHSKDRRLLLFTVFLKKFPLRRKYCALIYASKYHDVPIVVNVSGCFDMKKVNEQHLGRDFMERIKENGFIDVKDKEGKIKFRLTEESLLERLAIDMRAVCFSIAKDCRVFTVHGSEDDLVPVEDAFEFAKIIHNHKLHIVEGADHVFDNHQGELVEVVVSFVRESL